MRSWESEPGKMRQTELEEGEAFCYKDDTYMDTDFDLSYIGEKVQSLLGHLQKDFEGGVSAENLGEKFGGYGSFLPMHQCFPQLWSQPKSPYRLQDPCITSSVNTPLPEGSAHNSTMVNDVRSASKNGFTSPLSFYPSKNNKASSLDASIKKTTSLSSDQVAEAYAGKTELPHRKSDPPTELRTLKVRLKIGSDRMTQYNAEIQSLGLTSPSSSTGNILEESNKLKPEYDESPDESPSKILQIMTSFLVGNGSLLSPLCEDFSNLGRKTESFPEREHKTTSKSAAISLRIREKGVSKWIKSKSAGKIENVERSENELILDISTIKQKNSGSDDLSCKLQQVDDFNSISSNIVCSTSNSFKRAFTDALRNSEKDVPLKKSKGSKDKHKGMSVSCNLVEDAFLGCTPTHTFGKCEQRKYRFGDAQTVGEHLTSISQKDISVRPGQDDNSQVNQTCGLIKESYADISECERTEVAVDKLSSKVCWKAASEELNGSGLSNDVNNSLTRKSKVNQSSNKLALYSSNTLRNGGHAVSKGKEYRKKEGCQARLSQRDVVDTNIERMDNPKRLLEKSSVNGSRNSNLDASKEQHTPADKLKERLSHKKHADMMTYEIDVAEPPAETIPFNEGIVASTGETVVDPVLIQEDWVGCDRCEKWRLLPYGTKSIQLPDKWVCSMIDWLPGMNRCDVSEDDTTSAVRASLLVPGPVNQYNVQAQADIPFSGLNSSSGRHYTPNTLNYASDPMAYQDKSQKMKERSNTGSMYDTVPSDNVSKTMQCQSLKERNSKETSQAVAGAKAISKSNFPHPNKSTVSLSKINKRKDNHMVGDNAKLRKKIKKETFQDVQEVKSMNSKVARKMDHFQASGDNPDRIDHNLNPGLLHKEVVREKKKLSLQKDRSILSKDNLQSSALKQKGQIREIPDNGLSSVNVSNKIEASIKKRKFKDCEDTEHQVKTREKNLNHREKDVLKKEGKDEIPHKTKDGDVPKNRKVSEAGVGVLSSRSNEIPIKKGVEKKCRLNSLKVKLPLTKQDIEELKKDLGCELFSRAATSSSSKISDSRKNKGGFLEAKDSPEESVSSSPMRMPYVNQVLPLTKDTPGITGSKVDGFSLVGNTKRSLNLSIGCKPGITKKGSATVTCNLDPMEKIGLDFRESIAAEKPFAEHVSHYNHSSDFEDSFLADNEGSNLEHGHGYSSIPFNCNLGKEVMGKDHSNTVLCEQNPRKNSSRKSSYKNRTNGEEFDGVTEKICHPSTGSQILDSKEKMKEEMDADEVYGMPQYEVLSNVKHPFSAGSSVKSVHRTAKSIAPEKGFVNENISNLTTSTSLKEARDSLKKAEELKNHAYLIKSSGFGSESNYEYFKASLMFLHGASLFEVYNGENTKNSEINPLQLYSTAAKLCETCAYEYEKVCELAAATLAYKCMEIAYLRIVYCKSSSATRICRDLQSSLQMASQGESPSSSASDIDNLNNLMVTDRSTFSKGSDPQAVNHAMFSRSRTNFIRLLDFTKDVNSAMEAAKKLQDTYAAAHAMLEESQNKKAVVAVKRVIDFSFHDVEQLINSVRLAFDAINRQAPAPSNTRDQ